MSAKVVLLIIAAVLFGVEAVWHKNIVAAGLCCLAVAFIV
jgi:hypothetical protein